MSEIDLEAFATAHASGVTVIDVREPDEYAAAHVPGARLIPLAQLPQHLSELTRDERVYVICASGGRSLAAVDLLARARLDAVSVAGGTNAWQRAGNQITSGMRP